MLWSPALWHHQPFLCFSRKKQCKWKASLQEWKKEETQKQKTPEALFDRAKSLIASANSMQQYSTDESADILFLRASAILHDFLSQYSDNSNAGEALFLLGNCYETLHDLQLWSLHDLYYEACVRQFPHTPIAGSCYRRYEQSIYSGYTGSGGTYLPSQVKTRLKQLKALAQLEKK